MITRMAVLTRRLQVLLDERRFEGLEALARERKTTVAALVRESLDRTYPPDSLSAQEAADRFLARPPIDIEPWDDVKAEIEDSLERSVRR